MFNFGKSRKCPSPGITKLTLVPKLNKIKIEQVYSLKKDHLHKPINNLFQKLQSI